jgi:hypothetical protein
MGLFAYHFGWTPAVVRDLDVEDFRILSHWLEQHEKQQQDEE